VTIAAMPDWKEGASLNGAATATGAAATRTATTMAAVDPARG